MPLERKIIGQMAGPVVLHVCGDTDLIVDQMCETGAAGISIEEKTDLRRAVRSRFLEMSAAQRSAVLQTECIAKRFRR